MFVETFESGLSLSMENIILLFTAFGIIVVASKDLRIAIMFGTVIFLGEFIAFYTMSVELLMDVSYYNSMLALIFMIVLLSLSLLISFKKEGGVSIV